MDLFPKFIVEDGCIILGKVTYHKDLAENKENVKGGGTYKYIPVERTFELSGSSYEFGPAKLEDIKKAVGTGEVYSDGKIMKLSNANYTYRHEDGTVERL